MQDYREAKTVFERVLQSTDAQVDNPTVAEPIIKAHMNLAFILQELDVEPEKQKECVLFLLSSLFVADAGIITGTRIGRPNSFANALLHFRGLFYSFSSSLLMAIRTLYSKR